MYVIVRPHAEDKPRMDYSNVTKVDIRGQYTYLSVDGLDLGISNEHNRIDIENDPLQPTNVKPWRKL